MSTTDKLDDALRELKRAIWDLEVGEPALRVCRATKRLEGALAELRGELRRVTRERDLRCAVVREAEGR